MSIDKCYSLRSVLKSLGIWLGLSACNAAPPTTTVAPSGHFEPTAVQSETEAISSNARLHS